MKRILIPVLLATLLTGGVGPAAFAAEPRSHPAQRVEIVNSYANGQQVVKLDTQGSRVDAHGSGIYEFGGIFYLYGESYACGWAYNLVDGPPPCGMRIYQSTDLVHWTYVGPIFDVHAQPWRTWCASASDGGMDGCWEPHVLFDKATGQYVLWVLARGIYRVLTANTPTGPFHYVGNATVSVGGVEGSYDLFQDGGHAYVDYSNIASRHVYVEQLSPTYLTAVGPSVDTGMTGEANPAFVRDRKVYIVSGSICGFCSGTPTSYVMASAPLGHYSQPVEINPTSCSGQPAKVTQIGSTFLFQSDRWTWSPQEAQANYYWGPLSFNSSGGIEPFACDGTVGLHLSRPSS